MKKPTDKQNNNIPTDKPYHVATEEIEEKLQEKMGEISLKEKERLTQDAATEMGVNYINLRGFPIGPETLSILTEEEAIKYQCICFLKSGKEIRLGTPNIENPELNGLREKIESEYQSHVVVYLITEHSFNEALKLYKSLPRIKEEIKGIEITQESIEKFKTELINFQEVAKKIHQVPLTETLTLILAGAIQSEASDLHIEAEESDIKVRYRIDGVLHNVASLPKDMWKRIISRIKLLAGLKINIEKAPQDGRVNIILKDDKIDVRVSTVPTAYGESVVMRLLRSSAAGLVFEDLGLTGEAFDRLKREIMRPNGMVITSGPTGSGKTTTLYAVLNKLNNPENKIITLEDPVEYRLEGINQSQVDPFKKYTYANGLKSILRQDPDIIMVGEIRDLETVEISIQAALTGHLVLSTIHSNDSAGVIPRFLAMGTKPFLLAPALNAVMAQRLVRKLCPHCKVEDRLDAETKERVEKIIKEIPGSAKVEVDLKKEFKFYRSEGCEACNRTAFKGRTGIYEVFTMNAEIEKIILSGRVSEYQMKDVAAKHGMVTMAQDGILKAIKGITSVSEVFRVAE